MGLQTGTRLAVTKRPIVDPSNFKILAYEVDGPLLNERPSFILIADVRELSDIGMIIDSSDEFIGVEDVIAFKKIHDLDFDLINMDVIDESKQKLGKVEDFTLNTDNFIIQQISVKRGLIKSLTEASLLIHRSQIVEVNNQSIIVKTLTRKLSPIEEINKLSYVNPFRSPKSQPEASVTDSAK